VIAGRAPGGADDTAVRLWRSRLL